MCIINGELVPYLKASLLEKMKNLPYSLAVDDSSDNGLQKMNPLTVRIFDVKRGRVTTQLLDMCLTSGWDGGTAAAIFEKIDEKISLLLPSKEMAGPRPNHSNISYSL